MYNQSSSLWWRFSSGVKINQLPESGEVVGMTVVCMPNNSLSLAASPDVSAYKAC